MISSKEIFKIMEEVDAGDHMFFTVFPSNNGFLVSNRKAHAFAQKAGITVFSPAFHTSYHILPVFDNVIYSCNVLYIGNISPAYRSKEKLIEQLNNLSALP